MEEGVPFLRTARALLRAVAVGAVATILVAPASMAHADPSLQQIQQQIDAKSKALEKVVEQYDRNNEQLKATKAQADALQKRMAPLQRQMDDAYARVGDLAAQAYMGGQVGATNALLDAGSASSLIDQLSSLDQMARSQREDIEGYTTLKASYDVQKKKLDGLQQHQAHQANVLSAQRKSIKSELTKLYDMRRKAYGTAQVASGTGAGASAPSVSVSGRAGAAVSYAYGALGKPYVWAADGPDGYDCSGLTLAAWRAAGVSLPHNAAMQWDATTHISRSQIAPGDLVFYESLGHVAIYVGSGKVIHAPTFGDVVKVSSIDMMPVYGISRP
jgi:cell wall-associated NlpC family hydrolase